MTAWMKGFKWPTEVVVRSVEEDASGSSLNAGTATTLFHNANVKPLVEARFLFEIRRIDLSLLLSSSPVASNWSFSSCYRQAFVKRVEIRSTDRSNPYLHLHGSLWATTLERLRDKNIGNWSSFFFFFFFIELTYFLSSKYHSRSSEMESGNIAQVLPLRWVRLELRKERASLLSWKTRPLTDSKHPFHPSAYLILDSVGWIIVVTLGVGFAHFGRWFCLFHGWNLLYHQSLD